jgi:hypothetical protein
MALSAAGDARMMCVALLLATLALPVVDGVAAVGSALTPRTAAGLARGAAGEGRGGEAMRLRGGGEGAFEIHYRCSRQWQKAFVHYSLDEGATWSLKPDGPAGGDIIQGQHTGTDAEMTHSPAGIKWKSFR